MRTCSFSETLHSNFWGWTPSGKWRRHWPWGFCALSDGQAFHWACQSAQNQKDWVDVASSWIEQCPAFMFMFVRLAVWTLRGEWCKHVCLRWLGSLYFFSGQVSVRFVLVERVRSADVSHHSRKFGELQKMKLETCQCIWTQGWNCAQCFTSRNTFWTLALRITRDA